MNILDLTPEEVYEYVLNQVRRNNPELVVGERMQRPCEFVWDGKLVELGFTLVPSDAVVYTLDFKPPHVTPEYISVDAKPVKILFSQLENLRLPYDGKYLYPFTVHIPHRDMLSKHSEGDKIWIYDDALHGQEITLTQEIINNHSYLIFRFAVADH